MLDAPRYLLGVVEILALGGFAWLGASALHSRLLPDFRGAPAHLATAVLTLALLLWVAELLGTHGAFEPWPYLAAVGVAGVLISTLSRGWRGGWCLLRSLRGGGSFPRDRTRGATVDIATLIALAIAAAAVVKFGLEVKAKLGTGMTGFDSTWYHGPFAAGFFQSGDTWDLHFIAPQFLAWFYPANSEVFHAIGMLSFDRDILSPLLNLGWLAGCLVACWCIGRPHGVGPWSLALGAGVLSVPAFADQAGEARNDIVGTFFLLAAVALLVNAWAVPRGGGRHLSPGALIAAGLAVGLAAGTKLNFLLPAAVFVLGLSIIAPQGGRWRAFGIATLASLAGGGYWYLRNLIHTGNPLPWVKDLGPVSLPAPEQALGGREGHTVLGYMTDGAVWADWFLPGLHDGFGVLWPLLLVLALGGLFLGLGRRLDPALRISAAVGMAAALAWLVAPTSASGPEGMPRGFESGLRYLIPALVLGVALLPMALPMPLRGAGAGWSPNGRILKLPRSLARHLSGRGVPRTGTIVLCLVAAIVVGYPVQRHYLESRYADPSFSAPGLNAAFAWSRDISDAHIATTSTRQYPLFGTDLSNRVDFIGLERPHGGFVAPTDCPTWRRLLNAGDYDYVIASFDRIEPGQPPYPPQAAWTSGPAAQAMLREKPTVVFKLAGPLDPSAC